MSGKQLGFADYEQSMARKRTKRERFLAQMEAVVPWKALIDLISERIPDETTIPRQAARVAALLTRWRPCCGFT